jgi:hypothetical protein
LVFLAVGASAQAQGNALSAPTGGRSTLMGNTGVALARDGSAPFLNPATIVRIDDNSLAFSANFYSFADTNFSGWHQPAPVDASRFGNFALRGTSIASSGFHIFPSTLCLFFTVRGVTAQGSNEEVGIHRGRQKLAICFGSTEYEDVLLPALAFGASTPLGMTAQTQSVVRYWNRFQAGPTYSIALGDSFAVGVSLHGIYTSAAFVLASSSITSTEANGAVQSSLGADGKAYGFDLAALVGATYHEGNMTFGASVQLPSLHVFGSYQGTLHSEYGIASVDTATLTSGSGGFSAPTPMRFAIGAGAEWGRVALELDESFQLPIASIDSAVSGTTTSLMGSATTTTSFNAAYSVHEHPVANTALGAEYFLSTSFSVLGGASTSFSTLPALSPTISLGNLVQARSNSATASFGIGSYGGGGDLLVGAQFGYAWGQAMAVNPYVLPNDWAVVDMRSYSVMLILAGATDLRAIGRAVEKVEKAVTTGNPELPTAAASHPQDAAKPAATRELPRSGASDPRNVIDPDTGKPAQPKPAPPSSGSPADDTRTLPSPSLDPANQTFPPR